MFPQDLYSYNKEQAVGDLHNTLVVVQHNLPLSLDGAVSWLENEHADLARTFLSDLENLPAFGSNAADSRARQWVSDLGQMVRGHVDYCFATPRYFKPEAQVKERGWVELLPQKHVSAAAPVDSASTQSQQSITISPDSPISMTPIPLPSQSTPPPHSAAASTSISSPPSISSQVVRPLPELLTLVRAFLAQRWVHIAYVQVFVVVAVLLL